MKYHIKIITKPKTHDSDDVVFTDKSGDKVGFGFKSKKTGRICIMRCPKCRKENYALAISTGSCAFCHFDPNK